MSSEEIFQKFLAVYSKAKEKIGDEMATWNKVFQFEITGLDPFYLEFRSGEFKVENGKHPNPLATLSMDKDVLLDIVNGTLDPMVAFMRGKLRISGNVMETVNLRKMFEVIK